MNITSTSSIRRISRRGICDSGSFSFSDDDDDECGSPFEEFASSSSAAAVSEKNSGTGRTDHREASAMLESLQATLSDQHHYSSAESLLSIVSSYSNHSAGSKGSAAKQRGSTTVRRTRSRTPSPSPIVRLGLVQRHQPPRSRTPSPSPSTVRRRSGSGRGSIKGRSPPPVSNRSTLPPSVSSTRQRVDLPATDPSNPTFLAPEKESRRATRPLVSDEESATSVECETPLGSVSSTMKADGKNVSSWGKNGRVESNSTGNVDMEEDEMVGGDWIRRPEMARAIFRQTPCHDSQRVWHPPIQLARHFHSSSSSSSLSAGTAGEAEVRGPPCDSTAAGGGKPLQLRRFLLWEDRLLSSLLGGPCANENGISPAPTRNGTGDNPSVGAKLDGGGGTWAIERFVDATLLALFVGTLLASIVWGLVQQS